MASKSSKRYLAQWYWVWNAFITKYMFDKWSSYYNSHLYRGENKICGSLFMWSWLLIQLHRVCHSIAVKLSFWLKQSIHYSIGLKWQMCNHRIVCWCQAKTFAFFGLWTQWPIGQGNNLYKWYSSELLYPIICTRCFTGRESL